MPLIFDVVVQDIPAYQEVKSQIAIYMALLSGHAPSFYARHERTSVSV